MGVREEICEVGKLLYDRGYVVSNDGNISVRTGENEVIITPSGIGKGRMTPEILVKTDLAGNVLEGERNPSSEFKMHLEIYRQRPDVTAVVHAHPVTATAFAVCRRELKEAFLPEVIINFGKIPVTDFAMLSTEEVPKSLLPFVQEYNGVLLANHGAIAWGENLWSAFDKLETIEHCAKIYKNILQIGGGVELSEDETEHLIGLRSFYRKNFGKREK